MKFSHDGKYIATAGMDCQVYVWECATSSSDSNDSHNGVDQPDNNRQEAGDSGVNSMRQSSAHSPGNFTSLFILPLCLEDWSSWLFGL